MATSAVLLLEARTRAGLSRRALAARAGTPISTVSRIEEEQSDPTLPMLERLLAAAGSRLVIEARPCGDHPTMAELATAVDRDRDLTRGRQNSLSFKRQFRGTRRADPESGGRVQITARNGDRACAVCDTDDPAG